MSAIDRIGTCMRPLVKEFPREHPLIRTEPDVFFRRIRKHADKRGVKDDLINFYPKEDYDDKETTNYNYYEFLNSEQVDEIYNDNKTDLHENSDDILQTDDEKWKKSHIIFDDEGNPQETTFVPYANSSPEDRNYSKQVDEILKRECQLQRYEVNSGEIPDDIPSNLAKYWHQRHRLFTRFDCGIKLDNESWYSVTPELIASHQAFRCSCETVVDAFCGAGGNAIQLAANCDRVIAIDIDPAKIALAKHNAELYGVANKIEFIVGDFFKLAEELEADVVFLSPPWGGLSYLKSDIYDVFKLDGDIDGQHLMDTAMKISSSVALYLPKNSNIYQMIYLAGPGGLVDIEYNHMTNKRKGLTAYYGELVHYYSDSLDY